MLIKYIDIRIVHQTYELKNGLNTPQIFNVISRTISENDAKKVRSSVVYQFNCKTILNN